MYLYYFKCLSLLILMEQFTLVVIISMAQHPMNLKGCQLGCALLNSLGTSEDNQDQVILLIEIYQVKQKTYRRTNWSQVGFSYHQLNMQYVVILTHYQLIFACPLKHAYNRPKGPIISRVQFTLVVLIALDNQDQVIILIEIYQLKYQIYIQLNMQHVVLVTQYQLILHVKRTCL